ncbi:hypothetical protein NC653_021512 [Populus alba x Populus x berolinensis]|uniref:Uncharacterized protein n=1 Tax=Populus alba x Populus x berolinensis TaxID=444605 RepID=A0AAD6MNH7_9ROSI|nr:hypothetical protein NC653_021512 [Populus alba x Populus x berolinensis]
MLCSHEAIACREIVQKTFSTYSVPSTRPSAAKCGFHSHAHPNEAQCRHQVEWNELCWPRQSSTTACLSQLSY